MKKLWDAVIGGSTFARVVRANMLDVYSRLYCFLIPRDDKQMLRSGRDTNKSLEVVSSLDQVVLSPARDNAETRSKMQTSVSSG